MGSGSGGATKSTGRSSWAVRKARTRQALIDVALELFAAQRYESTSIEQIADRAGVSPRTFFRYFVTKESVLFFGEDDYVRSLVEVYVAQPAALNEMEAMRASFVTLAPRIIRIRERVNSYEKAVAASAVLRGRAQDSYDANVAAVAGAIARRRGLAQPDESCELLAAVGNLCLRRATAHWLRDHTCDLEKRITAEFTNLTRLVCSSDGP